MLQLTTNNTQQRLGVIITMHYLELHGTTNCVIGQLHWPPNQQGQSQSLVTRRRHPPFATLELPTWLAPASKVKVKKANLYSALL